MEYKIVPLSEPQVNELEVQLDAFDKEHDAYPQNLRRLPQARNRRQTRFPFPPYSTIPKASRTAAACSCVRES